MLRLIFLTVLREPLAQQVTHISGRGSSASVSSALPTPWHGTVLCHSRTGFDATVYASDDTLNRAAHVQIVTIFLSEKHAFTTL